MPPVYLHNHRDFSSLIRIVSAEMQIAPVLVEKDYWIMHCLHGLQQLALRFELKGGTSLSKGFRIIDRFSEDIDIRIDPPAEQDVKVGRNQNKDAHVASRRAYYDWLAATIKIDGIIDVSRDHDFDDEKLRSGGIRLRYTEVAEQARDIKEGILLEVGFDDVTPNVNQDISSWAYDFASTRTDLIDNRAMAVPCYSPGYTLVEKLQTISTKYRRQRESGEFPANFMRHYYDVARLLGVAEVQAFVGTDDYYAHKARRFRSENQDVRTNDAFHLSDLETRKLYEEAYERTRSLYYSERPSLQEILDILARNADRL